MNFTNESEEIMKLFMPHFNKFLVKKTPLKQKKMDNILSIFYNEIKLASIWANTKNTINKIQTQLKEANNKDDSIPKWILQESQYIPEFIQSYIIKHLKGYIIFSCKINDRNIKIYFGLLNNADFNALGKFDKYVKRMIIWLKIAFLYAPDRCSKNLNIFCFLTPFKKQLPGNQFEILSDKNCNSAVTTSCRPHGEILLYRQEEFMKVFIHESFHTLGLDFSNMPLYGFNKKVRYVFPLNSEFNLFEAYAEFWANTMNCLITAYDLLDDKDDVDNFHLYSDFCMQFEQIFSLFQMVKTLDFMGIEYTNLYNTDDASNSIRRYLFKEKTNVFAYYIVKNILLYNNVEFLIWCKNHNNNIVSFNKTSNNLEHFWQFIISLYNKPGFLKDIENMESVLKNIKGKCSCPNHNTLTKTMRMSLCEIN